MISASEGGCAVGLVLGIVDVLKGEREESGERVETQKGWGRQRGVYCKGFVNSLRDVLLFGLFINDVTHSFNFLYLFYKFQFILTLNCDKITYSLSLS